MESAVSKAGQSPDVQFVPDAEDWLIAGCNVRVGLWAGRQLGLPEASRATYALEVMAAEDVVDKIMRDLADRRVPITRGQVLVQVSKNYRRLSMQFLLTRREL
jgi:hypothetical protein